MNNNMKAVVTTGNGGFEKLVFQELPVPKPGVGEVLIRVLAAGINNTDINTRLGWYSRSVTSATGKGGDAGSSCGASDGGWSSKTPFPLVQGADCCGIVVSAGGEAGSNLLDRRVLVRPTMRKRGFDSLEQQWLGCDFDGAYAQYVKVPVSEVFPIRSDWCDEQLGAIPCAWGTSESMLHKAGVKAGDTVLVTGASGGVGSASIQLAKRRGARVIAVASVAKHSEVEGLGADELLDKTDNPLEALGERSVDVVLDLVAGDSFSALIKTLKPGGRLVSSGAIAGPIVELDMRDIYLKDLTLIGSTAWDEPVFANLIAYIEQGDVQPPPVQTFPLERVVEAQQAFMEKQFVGKLVLLPPE